MSEFPTIHQLADASLKEVLGAWQGLGYNRRAKFLHESARLIVTQWAGKVPHDPTSLASLPGIGKATASAICAFAFNMPSVFIETNIRSVFIHHFFKGSALVDDKEIVCLVERALDRGRPRIWYSALMDYGSSLKKRTANPSRRSKHHVRHDAFVGSSREARGQVLAALIAEPRSLRGLYRFLSLPAPRIKKATQELQREGMVAKQNQVFVIP